MYTSFALMAWPDCYLTNRLDERNDGGEIQDYLREKTGQSTVPNIFISKYYVWLIHKHQYLYISSDQKHIGGNSDLQSAFKNGSLKSIIGAST
jgi:glutaredoxin 3